MLIRFSATTVLVATLASLCACGGDGSGASSALACDGITTSNLALSGLKVATSVSVPASGTATTAQGYPAHCKVTGSINDRTGTDGKPYAIGFELRLPASGWNTKFFFQGGGGLDGVISPALGGQAGPTNALTQGYAVVSTDAGHQGTSVFDAAFGVEPQARIDYGYNAVGTLTPSAKKIVERFYGSAPTRSYFVGCSNGGRQGMVAASRFADQFDGIVSGDPGFNLPKAAVAEAWNNHQMLAVSPGNPGGAFTTAEMSLVGSAVLAKCDALDGATDGIVSDLAACKAAFNLSTDVPTCAGARDGTCLAPAQKTALQAILDGPKSSGGTPLYADWARDPGIGSSGWRVWMLDSPFLPGGASFNTFIGAPALSSVFATPPTSLAPTNIPGLLAYQDAFDFDNANTLINGTNATYTESAMSFMAPPHPTSFPTLKSKGKLLVYHGAADPVFSVNDSIGWYQALSTADASAPNYARLFVVPGMTHCSGGPSTDTFDAFAALVEWVEKANAPDTIIASVTPGNPDVPANWSSARSRPLCAYPKKAVLKSGATDLESAGSFVCQ